MVDLLSDEQIAHIKEGFNLIDKDDDGRLTWREVQAAFHLLGDNISEQEVRDIVNVIDKDGNSLIEFSEFLTMMAQRGSDHDRKKEARERFEWFNKSQSGKLTAEELQGRLQEIGHNLTIEEAQAMIRLADHDGDGMLSFTEFQDYENEVFNFKM